MQRAQGPRPPGAFRRRRHEELTMAIRSQPTSPRYLFRWFAWRSLRGANETWRHSVSRTFSDRRDNLNRGLNDLMCCCRTGGGAFLKSRTGSSTPGSPRSCDVSNGTPSPLRPRTSAPEEDSIRIEKNSYENMFQDIAGIKKMLLKLKQVLTEVRKSCILLRGARSDTLYAYTVTAADFSVKVSEKPLRRCLLRGVQPPPDVLRISFRRTGRERARSRESRTSLTRCRTWESRSSSCSNSWRRGKRPCRTFSWKSGEPPRTPKSMEPRRERDATLPLRLTGYPPFFLHRLWCFSFPSTYKHH